MSSAIMTLRGIENDELRLDRTHETPSLGLFCRLGQVAGRHRVVVHGNRGAAVDLTQDALQVFGL
jgi:hypothetical protein